MAQWTRPLLVFSVLTMVAFAGCVADDKTAPPVEPDLGDDPKLVRSADGRDLRTELIKEDRLDAPEWRVGEAFGIHVYFGPDDAAGTHMNAIVVEDKGGSWYVAPDDPDVAKDDAIFDIPVFGDIKKSDLSSTGFGSEWKLFDFPLFDGKTWNGQFTVPSFDSFDQTPHEVEFIVNYEPKISTPEGDRPGFRVMGHTGDGDMLMEYSYTPSIGWLAHFWLYDLTTEDTSDYFFHVMNMGHQYNWTGDYYAIEAKQAAEVFSDSFLNPEDPGSSTLEPTPHTAFTMAEGSTYLYGFVYAYAFAGATEVMLVDPNGAQHEVRAGAIRQGSDPAGFDFQFTFLDIPAVAGDWNAALVGAGVASGAGLYLFELTETVGTL